jgi:periplasmic protein TonB
MTRSGPSTSQRFRRLIPVLGGVLIVAVVVGALIWFIRGMQEKPKSKRQVAQVIQLIRPPPPPPDQPPPPPPPPEEKIEEPLPQETPEDAPPDDAPPAEQLGLDAEGVAGADGFGLAARKGGRDLLGTGGSAFAWYTSSLKDRILDELSDDERIRRGKYQVTVSVWLRNDGTVEQIKLRSTSGDLGLDRAIEARLQRMSRAPGAPPLEMPQPVTLRIVSK